MSAYYNEHDPQAAAWLRELIKAGHIAPGDVDERSIEDVVPNELAGYTQCHFFAGIGVWSYALRCAGWPDDRPVWTGSCPCQPFSAAGKGNGFADERHLWPAFYHLISQSRPDVVFGEQVASIDGLDWLDVVYADLEAAGYAVGALDLCAAGFGAPHIRQRLFFVANAETPERRRAGAEADKGRRAAQIGRPSFLGSLADAELSERGPIHCARRRLQREDGLPQGEEGAGGFASNGAAGDMGNAKSERCGKAGPSGGRSEERAGDASESCDMGNADIAGRQGRQLPSIYRIRSGESECAAGTPGATNGFWRDAEWIYCRDGKYRAIEPMPESMADGLAGDLGLVRLQSYSNRPHEERLAFAPLISKGKKRVMRLRGYGNAICAPVAEAFIRAYLERG